MSKGKRRLLAGFAGVAALSVVVLVATGFRNASGLASGTIAVGYGNNLTGFLAVHDRLISDGAKLAVEQINAKGGIGGKVKINLKIEDVKSDPATSVEVAKDLIAKKVTALILPCNTDFQVAMTAVAAKAGQFTLSPCNADPTLWKKFPIYWPVGMAGNAQGTQLADYVKSTGHKNAWVLDSNFLYINLMTKYFVKAAPSRGIKVVGKDNVPFGATGFPTDFSAQVTKIKNASPQPDVIMTGLFTPFVDTLTKQLRAAGIQTQVVGTDGMDTGLHLSAGGKAVEGTAFTTFGFPTAGSAAERFYADYGKRFGKRPDGSFAALGYESIKVLEAAVLKADSTDPKAIQKALAGGLTVQGALGAIKYLGGGEHNPIDSVAVVQVKNGKFALVKNTVPTNIPKP